jgi:hypothetical protein
MKVYDVIRKIKTLIGHANVYGLVATFNLLKQRVSSTQSSLSFFKADPLSFYDFVNNPAVPLSLDLNSVSSNTINWVIPPYGKGSGGHLNIFRFITNLESLGFNCRIVIVGSPQPVSAEQAKKEIEDWFFPLKAEIFLGMDNAQAACYTIATEWRTAYWVRSFSATKHRCYFVQDFEPWFFAMGSEYVFAEQTYSFGFYGITAGTWLKEKLALEYGMQTAAVGFSYDRHLYQKLPRRNEPIVIQRVFFYARPPTQRRAFELGLLVLNEVTKRMPQVEVVFAGWDVSGYVIPFKHLNAGLLSLEELPDLYSQCDVALVLSLSNLSLLPLELMACGTPVVSNKAPWTEWLLNEDNARLSATTVTDLTDAVCHILNNPDEAARLRRGGFTTVAQTDWYKEACVMANILRQLNGEYMPREEV